MIAFGTKAETLDRLIPYVKSAQILPQIRFSVVEWKEDRNKILDCVMKLANQWNAPLIVRSSAISEDLYGQSLAGHFTSVLNVQGVEVLSNAIEEVITSYGEYHELDQVFVQPMLEQVLMSGVAFTIDPNTGGYYYVINYDDTSGSTSSVTGGVSNHGKVFYAFKSADVGNIVRDERIRLIIDLLKELEDLFSNDALDVEFAFSNNKLYLLQVRPLICNQRSGEIIDFFETALHEIHAKVCCLNQSHPYLYGSRTILGVMPDWNPAEMIGIRPRPLALSLYKDVITDSIWAFQRSNYGYQNLRSFPLMYSLHGMPYIDVRIDFNSFIPQSLDGEIAARLVDYYIDALEKNPSHHDKVEFEIVYTCYTFDLPERLQKLEQAGFSEEERRKIIVSLRDLTNAIINDTNGHWRQDISRIEKLDSRYRTVIESDMDKVAKIYWLLEDCKRYGTLPFAGLARAAFIATQIMQSLIQVGVINQAEYMEFMSELEGIGTRMTTDFCKLSKNTFLEKYGHLRPGTYDILSPRYDEVPEQYFQWDENRKKSEKTKKKQGFMLSLEQIRKVKSLLKEHELHYDLLGLFDFIKNAIENREYAKFIFTRSLSEAISLFDLLGKECGFSSEECSYAKIDCIKRLYDTCKSPYTVLAESIVAGKEEYSITQQLILPSVILKPNDIWAFQMPECQPNFITLKKSFGPVAFKGSDSRDFAGAILMIPSADPGYDWIFSCGIAGFITMYGGVNSHMAVRAGELGIPAVIGAGEVLYDKWATAEMLEIDCANRQVRIVK